MIQQHTESEVSLAEFLSSRARHATDSRLALDVGGGVVVALVAALWHGWAWALVASAGVCVAAFGAWGIADRELREAPPTSPPNRLLAIARVMFAGFGFVAAVAVMLLAMKYLLGRIIS